MKLNTNRIPARTQVVHAPNLELSHEQNEYKITKKINKMALRDAIPDCDIFKQGHQIDIVSTITFLRKSIVLWDIQKYHLDLTVH